ncbi:MAG TPA: molecular chaperone DnaJ, partial [Clostridiales bacterium]|nr:molecular chaperone DnaJ [Clostridiales bacterium]
LNMQNTYRQRSYNYGSSNSSGDCCMQLICADCCCECMGGDLISCC